MASEGNELVPLYGKFTPFVSLTSFPVHMGSKYLSNIQLFATAFLPYLNMVIAFEADRNNISTNSKADETWDCRVSTMDTYHGLIEYGVELDVDAALDHFKDKPIQMEDRDVAKAFTTQLTVLACLAIAVARGRGAIDAEAEARLTIALTEVPSRAAEILNHDDRLKQIAQTMVEARDVLYLGRGTSYPIAMEGALKLKEVSYIHAEGYAAGEMKHGPIALIDDQVPVIVIAPSDPLFDTSMAAAWSQAGRLLLVWDGASGRCQSSAGAAWSLKLLLLSGAVGRCQWSGEFM